jgi:putative NADPH-quinone reductase
MKEYYLAVTYDVCEHNNLYVDMNEYPLDMSIDLDEQISKFAKMDVAPLVKVYESNSSDFEELRLYKKYKFKEYECGCNQ